MPNDSSHSSYRQCKVSVQSKGFIKLKEMSHGQQNDYGHDKILHCHSNSVTGQEPLRSAVGPLSLGNFYYTGMYYAGQVEFRCYIQLSTTTLVTHILTTSIYLCTNICSGNLGYSVAPYPQQICPILIKPKESNIFYPKAACHCHSLSNPFFFLPMKRMQQPSN